ncbi:MAG: CAP domain-containing protein [Planctomycetota bacterium]
MLGPLGLRFALLPALFSLLVAADAHGSSAPLSPALAAPVAGPDDPDVEALGRRFLRVRGEERDAVWTQLLELCGPEQLTELVGERATELSRKVGRSGVLRKLARIAKDRARLDGLRANALALIDDEERYFFPFGGPDVTKKRAKAYAKVQEEIDGLVEEIEELWTSERTVEIDRTSRADLADLVWTLREAAARGAKPKLDRALPEWATALHVVVDDGREEVGIRSMPIDEGDAVRLLRDERVAAHNALVQSELRTPERIGLGDIVLHVAETALVDEVNAYRTMLGRPALTHDPRLFRAARVHADYCAERNELTHYQHASDTRRTPKLRGRTEGYPSAFGESLCGDQPRPRDVVRSSWCASSAEHRNVLSKKAREIGTARNGPVWVQLLGAERVTDEELRAEG